MIRIVNRPNALFAVAVAFVFSAMVAPPAGAADKSEKSEKEKGAQVVNFEKDAVGQLPKGWKADATNPKGPLAEWAVVGDKTAPEGKALAITKINDTAGGVFNLCFSPVADFRDGEIEVRIKPLSGKTDQGGGLIWRAKDARNYYIVRCNPLEPNLRLYYVKDGARKMIAEVTGVNVPTGQWSTIKVVQRGEKIEVSLNGKKVIEATDSTFTEAGVVGLWSKADAASAFADLKVEMRKEEGKEEETETGEKVKGREGKEEKEEREKTKAGEEKEEEKGDNDNDE